MHRTADIMNKLANAVAKHGCADSEYIPDDFFRRCPNAIAAMSELNLSHARMLEAAARENKTESLALDYEAMAQRWKTPRRNRRRNTSATARLRQSSETPRGTSGCYSVGAGSLREAEKNRRCRAGWTSRKARFRRLR